jgi:peptidoglycan/LPS O-acetylase OafA/YrhL
MPQLGPRASALLVAAAALTLVVNGYWHATDTSPDGFMIEAVADLPAAVAFASLIAVIAIGTGSGLAWLAAPPLVWFGQISYGFYLWHIPLIVWARGHGLLAGGALTDLAVLLPAAAAFGAASWYLVERPLMLRAASSSRKARPSKLAVFAPRRTESEPSELPVFAPKQKPEFTYQVGFAEHLKS